MGGCGNRVVVAGGGWWGGGGLREKKEKVRDVISTFWGGDFKYF